MRMYYRIEYILEMVVKTQHDTTRHDTGQHNTGRQDTGRQDTIHTIRYIGYNMTGRFLL